MVISILSRITFAGISLYEEEWGIPLREVTTTYCVYPTSREYPLKKIPTIVFTYIPSPRNPIAVQPLEHQQIPVILSELLLLIFHPEERGVSVLQLQASVHMLLL